MYHEDVPRGCTTPTSFWADPDYFGELHWGAATSNSAPRDDAYYGSPSQWYGSITCARSVGFQNIPKGASLIGSLEQLVSPPQYLCRSARGFLRGCMKYMGTVVVPDDLK